MFSGVNEKAWQVKSLVTNSNNRSSSSKIHKRPSVKCVYTYTKTQLRKNPSVKLSSTQDGHCPHELMAAMINYKGLSTTGAIAISSSVEVGGS